MKRFLIKTSLFLLPILAFFSVPFLVLKMTGENYSQIDNIIERKQKYLIGYAYNEANYKYLKSKEVKSRETQTVVALGSSRALQFREDMFTVPFYNAGYTITSVSDFVPFMESNLEEKMPEQLLVILDQWMFNKNWDDLSSSGKKKWQASFNSSATSSTILNSWKDLLAGKYGIGILFSKEKKGGVRKIGLNAVVNGKGFRSDGSMDYGAQIEKLVNKDSSALDFNFSDTYARIQSGTQRFEHGDEIHDKSLSVLNEFLTYCKSKQVKVVAILPPFADKVNQRMKETGKYGYLDSIYLKCKPIFDENNFELWDLTNLGTYGSDDGEVVDGFHGGEVTYLRMLIYMLENGSSLKNYANDDKLKNDLNNKKNNYIVYGH